MKRKLRGNLLGKNPSEDFYGLSKRQSIHCRVSINNLDNDENKIDLHRIYPNKSLLGLRKIDTELVIELRLLVKSMHKKVNKGTNSGCLDNQYR